MGLDGIAVYAAYSRKTELARVLETLQLAGFGRDRVGLLLALQHPAVSALRNLQPGARLKSDTAWLSGLAAVTLVEESHLPAALPQHLLRHSALLFICCRQAAESEWAEQIFLHTGAAEVLCVENREFDQEGHV